MAWTYSGDPASSDKDAVRFYIGDTDNSDQLLQDEEISFLLTTESSILDTAVAAAEGIAAKFSRKADKAVGDLKISLSQKADKYFTLADKLRQRAGILAVPFAGGLTQDEKTTASEDTNAVQPSFKRGMMGWSGTSLNGLDNQ